MTSREEMARWAHAQRIRPTMDELQSRIYALERALRGNCLVCKHMGKNPDCHHACNDAGLWDFDYERFKGE